MSEVTTIPHSVVLCNIDETLTPHQFVEVNIDGNIYKTQINHNDDANIFYGGANFISAPYDIGYEVDFSEYPFFFYVDSLTAEQPQIAFYMSNENGNEHTISIYTETEEVVGIDKKYLPEGVGYIEDVVELVAETIVTQMDESGNVAIGEIPELITPAVFEENSHHTYSIEFDGVVYELPPHLFVKNVVIMFGENPGKEIPFANIPFAIQISIEGNYLFTAEAGEHTVLIKYNKEHKISERFLTPRIWLDTARNQETGEYYIINDSGLSNAEIYNSNISSILVKEPDGIGYHALTLRQYDGGFLIFDEGDNSSMTAALSPNDMNWILEYYPPN